MTAGWGAEADNPDRRFPALDAVRAIGALLVVLTHVAFNTGLIEGLWGAVLSRADFGVALFFVLSGFLLSRPMFMARAIGQRIPSVRHYFWKRALRILPIYWVTVVVVMTCDSDNHGADWRQWLSNLTLTQIYRQTTPSSSLTQMWSLCTEVAFYIALPVLVLLLCGRRGFPIRRVLTGTALMITIGLVWAALVPVIVGTRYQAGQGLLETLPWFGVGMTFAALSAYERVTPGATRLNELARDLTAWWVMAFALFGVACSDLAGPRLLTLPSSWDGVFKYGLYAASAGCFIFPLVFGPELEGRARSVLAGRIPTALGEISYGIFCIHMFVLVVGMRILGLEIFGGHFLPVLAMVVVITIVLALLSYRFLELPFLRLKNRGPFVPKRPAIGETDAAKATSARV